MNREQKRNAARYTAKHLDGPITMQYGHNGEQVVITFARTYPALMLTLEQTDAMLNALQVAKRELLKHLGMDYPLAEIAAAQNPSSTSH